MLGGREEAPKSKQTITKARGNSKAEEKYQMYDDNVIPYQELRRRKQSRRLKGEWECSRCGYLHVASEPPPLCPECGGSAQRFDFWPYDDFDEEHWDWEEEE